MKSNWWDEIKIGDTLFAVRSCYGRKESKTLTIDKIGRQYFYAGDFKFSRKTGEHITDYSGNWQFWEKESDYLDDIKSSQIAAKIRDFLDPYVYKKKYTLAQVQQVAEILKIEYGNN